MYGNGYSLAIVLDHRSPATSLTGNCVFLMWNKNGSFLGSGTIFNPFDKERPKQYLKIKGPSSGH